MLISTGSGGAPCGGKGRTRKSPCAPPTFHVPTTLGTDSASLTPKLRFWDCGTAGAVCVGADGVPLQPTRARGTQRTGANHFCKDPPTLKRFSLGPIVARTPCVSTRHTTVKTLMLRLFHEVLMTVHVSSSVDSDVERTRSWPQRTGWGRSRGWTLSSFGTKKGGPPKPEARRMRTEETIRRP